MHKRYDKYEQYQDIHWQWYNNQAEYNFLVTDSLVSFENAELGTLVDIGAGDGLPLQLLGELGFKCYGVEPEFTAVDIAMNHNVSAEYFIETAEKFAQRGLKFDYLYSLNTIEHMDNPAVMLDIMKNVSKFGVIVTDDFSKHVEKDPYHEIEFTDETFTQLFKDFGLEKIKVRGDYIAYKVWNK